MQIRGLIKQTVAPAIAIICAGTIAHLQSAQVTAAEQQADQEITKAEALQEEAQYKTSMALAQKLPSSGFDNLIANWAFLNVVQYFGDDEARSKTGYSVTPEFFEVVVNRDPLFLDMYSYLSSMVTLYGAQPRKSVAMLEQGLAEIPEAMKPEAYFLWQAKATDELLFLGQPQAARQSYEQAANWAGRSSKPGLRRVAQRSRQTAEFLATNPDSRQAQVSSWSNILMSAVDQRTQQFASSQIEALGGRVSVNDDGLMSVQLPSESEQEQRQQ
ncbi:MAG: hypothetical protein AAF329_02450 [Cyanobacteria bacterium P01_A01_bin.17]